MRNREIVALIAYLQRLGTDIKVKDASSINNSKIRNHVKICKKPYGKYHRYRNLSINFLTHIFLFFVVFFGGFSLLKKTI